MATAGTRPRLAVAIEDLGVVAYAEAAALQERFARERREGARGDTLFLLEHPHVVTLGRNARGENVIAAPAELAAAGVEVHRASRGGDVTYHGPGQLVGYPVLFLPEGRRDVRGYVRDLEEALIRTLAELGVEAARDPGFPGVWVGREKVAALGVRIAGWVTTHGFALNVDPDLAYFRLINPCGLAGRGVTSIARLLGRAPAMSAVKAAVARHVGAVFG